MAFGTRKEETKEFVSSSQSVFAKDLSIKGDIVCNGLLRIEGNIEGSVKGNGEITVAENATAKAEIEGRKVIVLGRIEGNVKAKESVDIVASGKVFGDVTTDKIAIEEGAVFTGKCITKSPEPEKPLETPATLKDDKKGV
ncbi:MAG: bactofilin family protein [Caldisericaceae bacterium]